ncbi:hypothetical protein JOB18_019508 [Solea senegalensis]|uniref:Uncharacterized protein n=1 Tax=Solea senegalensis TaxID=28829 RepID=A0AAV6RHA2_SOLSE|nr:hypothetical protein JOB18_019508 [Solea senegalensis]
MDSAGLLPFNTHREEQQLGPVFQTVRLVSLPVFQRDFPHILPCVINIYVRLMEEKGQAERIAFCRSYVGDDSELHYLKGYSTPTVCSLL